jgi:polysaccharide export outer membrane protein
MTDMPMRILLSIFCVTIMSVAVPAVAQEPARPDESYKILPGDVLQVSVWKEPDLQLELLVRPDGAVSFPLAGEMSTRNKSVSELQDELKDRLARFINEPVVTVSVKEVLGNKIYVIGQVNNPGEFVVNPQVDVLQAIRILRRNRGVQTALSFNYKEVLRGRNLAQNVMLKSGDVVVVP